MTSRREFRRRPLDLVFRVRRGDHVVPLDDLLAFAAFGLAEGALVGVEVVPAFPGGRVDVLGGQQVQDVLGVALVGQLQGTVAEVVDKHRGGVLGVGLGVADQPDGAALDPAGGVEAGDDVATGLGEHVAFVIGDDGLRIQRTWPQSPRTDRVTSPPGPASVGFVACLRDPA